MAPATRKADGASTGGQSQAASLEPCAAQDREERARWAEHVKIARIEAQ
jgi:hypothetical protein